MSKYENLEFQRFSMFCWKKTRLTRWQKQYKITGAKGVWVKLDIDIVARSPWEACAAAKYHYPHMVDYKLKAMPQWER